MISYEQYASFIWGSYVRIVAQMSELLFKCWNCGFTPKSEQYNHLDGHWSLLIWFHYYFLSEPQSWHLNYNSDIWSSLTKMASFKPQKSRNGGQKKRHSPNPCWHGLFAKNWVQIGQFRPPWPHLYSTSAYRGLPPCTLSQHPDNRETGYSNVLGHVWVYINEQIKKVIWLRLLIFGRNFKSPIIYQKWPDQ